VIFASPAWLLALLALIFFSDRLIRYFRSRSSASRDPLPAAHASFDELSVSAPKGLYYDQTHTWTFMEENGTVRTGMDDFLRHVTGPVTRIEMKNPGDRITRGEPFLTVTREGKKLVMYSPLTGTIRARNEELGTRPSLLYNAPYSDGWVYRIEPSNWAREIQFLAMAEKYRSWLTYEFTRLRDFLAVSLSAHEVPFVPVILQDGGALKESLLADLGPEVWEDFQNQFLNTGK